MRRLSLLLVCAPWAFAAACGESEPASRPVAGDASTCTGAGCTADDSSVRGDDGTKPPPADADTDADAPVGYPDPLQGTTKLATLVQGGFQFTEGPVWIGGRLLFSDIPPNNIHELLSDGGTTVFRANSGGTNGLAVDPGGNLVACEGVSKRLTRSAATIGAGTTPIASTYMSAAFNAPNDVIVRKDGNAYFTDPCYGCTVTQNDEAVYRIDPQGAITRLAQNFTRPNGIALSPDDATLYVVDNGAGTLMSAPIDSAGAVGSFTKIGDVPGGDGMGVDDAGNLYVTDNAGVDVFDKTGKKLGTVTMARDGGTPAKPANCTFGGADRRTLYVTANAGSGSPATGLYAIRLNVPGLP